MPNGNSVAWPPLTKTCVVQDAGVVEVDVEVPQSFAVGSQGVLPRGYDRLGAARRAGLRLDGHRG